MAQGRACCDMFQVRMLRMRAMMTRASRMFMTREMLVRRWLINSRYLYRSSLSLLDNSVIMIPYGSLVLIEDTLCHLFRFNYCSVSGFSRPIGVGCSSTRGGLRLVSFSVSAFLLDDREYPRMDCQLLSRSFESSRLDSC